MDTGMPLMNLSKVPQLTLQEQLGQSYKMNIRFLQGHIQFLISTSLSHSERILETFCIDSLPIQFVELIS
jgi:hypothetical protein